MPFVFVAAPQYCDGAYISKGGTTTKNKKNEKKMKKKNYPNFPHFDR